MCTTTPRLLYNIGFLKTGGLSIQQLHAFTVTSEILEGVFFLDFSANMQSTGTLEMVQFSIRNHRWKALDYVDVYIMYNPEICKIFMHANWLWPKFTNFLMSRTFHALLVLLH